MEEREVLGRFLAYYGMEMPASARLSHYGREFSKTFPLIADMANPSMKPWRPENIKSLCTLVSGLDPSDYAPLGAKTFPKKSKPKTASITQVPSYAELQAFSNGGGKGATRARLKSWGVSWPAKRGWLKALMIEAAEREGIVYGEEDRIKKQKKRELITLRKRKHRAQRESKNHAPQSRPRTSPSQPPTPAAKKEFYDSWEWTTLRMKVLKKFGRECMCCGASPGSGSGVVINVDHIRPLSKYWELRLDETNLQVLCHSCNKGKGAWDETDYRPQH